MIPNTPTQIGKGVSAISPGTSASNDDLTLTKNLLASTGLVIEIPESQQDAVAALSGSGPAYFFNFIEAIVKGATELGLPQELATQLAIGTIVGSAAMLQESGLDAATLRKNVTSPNGTTAAALKVFSDSNLEKLLQMRCRRRESVHRSWLEKSFSCSYIYFFLITKFCKRCSNEESKAHFGACLFKLRSGK